MGSNVTEKALAMLRSLPRIGMGNIRENPGALIKSRRGRGQHGGDKHGHGNKGSGQRQNYMRIGYETGNNPFYLRFGYEPYYTGHHLRRQYPPITLLKLQKFIDTDRLDPTEFIDLTSICNTGLYGIEPTSKHFGIHLTDTEGSNLFNAKIDIEVQWISEPVIAAIERLGGSVSMAYYDLQSLLIMKNPIQFFKRGKALPRRMLPPQDVIEAYTDPKRRGYLADPQEVEYERGVLAQKYGYKLVQRAPPPRKDPRQIFFGLEPGWVVNLRDSSILKPKDPTLKEYYNS